MQIHAKIGNSLVNGPGKRAVIFFQGCSLQCPGCQNLKTHKRGPGECMSAFELAAWVKAQPGIEGVTFSGGEPLEQLDDGLDILAYELKQAGLSVGLFTGYTEKELEAGNFCWTGGSNDRAPKYKKAEAWKWLKGYLDWAVMGRYNQLERSSEPMVASRNQKLVIFNDCFDAGDFQEQRVEVIISGETGKAVITGFPQGELCAQ